jgi:hypothetical protein
MDGDVHIFFYPDKLGMSILPGEEERYRPKDGMRRVVESAALAGRQPVSGFDSAITLRPAKPKWFWFYRQNAEQHRANSA